MKKFITFMLCLNIVMSLAACGDSETTEQSSDTSAQTDVMTTTGENEEAEKIQETAASDDTTSSSESEEVTEIKELIIDEAVKPENFILSDSGENYETYTLENITYSDLMKYESKLTEEGFYIQRSAFGRPIEADNLNYEIKYQFQYTGTAYITSDTQLEERAAQGEEDYGNLTVTVRARDLSHYNLPPLPEEDWRTDDDAKKGWVMHRLNTYVNCSRETRMTLAKDYVEALKDAGYTLNAEEYPEGKEGNYVNGYIPLYYYYAEDENKNNVKVVVSSDEEIPYSLVGVKAEEWAEIEITFKKAE